MAAVVRPFGEGKEAGMARAGEQIEIFKMSSREAQDQTTLIKKARSLQERILARRGGELLPLSWRDMRRDREERAGRL